MISPKGTSARESERLVTVGERLVREANSALADQLRLVATAIGQKREPITAGQAAAFIAEGVRQAIRRLMVEGRTVSTAQASTVSVAVRTVATKPPALRAPLTNSASGSSVLPSFASPAGPAGPARVTQRPSAQTTAVKRVIECEYCRWPCKPENLLDHLRLVHGIGEHISHVASRKVSKHPSNSHRPVTVARSPAAVGGHRSNLVQCPKCTSRVRHDHLPGHLKRVHLTDGARPNPTLPSGGAGRPMESGDSAAMGNGSRTLDATRLYAHRYREGGRFGSHPSHDGFDDESGS
jgi:hypothetical protein